MVPSNYRESAEAALGIILLILLADLYSAIPKEPHSR